MTQYYITFKDGGFEYVDAYGYKLSGTRYEFDLGHHNIYYVTADIVKGVEVLA